MATDDGFSGIVDKRIIQKPSKFSGKDDEWMMWCFVFENYVDLAYPKAAEALARVDETPLDREIAFSSLGEEFHAPAKWLYALLAQTLTGTALKGLMIVKDKNGAEAWRMLKNKYEPRSGSRALGALMKVFKFSFRSEETFIEDIQEWTAVVESYEKSNKEVLSDSIKCAALSMQAPAAVRNYIHVHMPDLNDFDSMLRNITNWLLAQKS
jgi:hypothetical protein